MIVKLFNKVLVKIYPILVLTFAFGAWSNANLPNRLSFNEYFGTTSMGVAKSLDLKTIGTCSVPSKALPSATESKIDCSKP